jgi:hypothetical protein
MLPPDDAGRYRESRRQLEWYEPMADRLAREVEQLEAEVLAAIRQRQEKAETVPEAGV